MRTIQFNLVLIQEAYNRFPPPQRQGKLILFYQIVSYKIDFSATIIQCLELAYLTYREYYIQFNSDIKSLPFYILPQLQPGKVYNQGFFFQNVGITIALLVLLIRFTFREISFQLLKAVLKGYQKGAELALEIFSTAQGSQL